MRIWENYGEIIAACIALTGILVGLFWNQFFVWRKRKIEQKEKLNQLLFHLLELYFFYTKNNITELTQLYISKLEKKFGPIPSNDRPDIESFITSAVKERLTSMNSSEIEDLSKHYETAVKEVAQINPFLAYSLSGQSKRLDNLNVFHDYIESIEQFTESSEQEIISSIFANFTDERFIKETIDDIKDSALEVSKKIGILNYRKAKKFFKETEKAHKENLDKEINGIVDKLASHFNP